MEFYLTLCLLAALAVLSYALTRVMMARVRILDAPNDRSSHSVPIPRSGGIAIVLTFAIGMGLVMGGVMSIFQGMGGAMPPEMFWGFVGAIALIVGVSLVDDVRALGFRVKLLTQVLASVVVMTTGLGVMEISLPGLGWVELGLWGYVLTLFWVVGLTNAFNFMDGIDGLSGVTAIVAAGFFALLSIDSAPFVSQTLQVLIAACLGFLVLNWQPAKIFMGDTGSQFLGFVLAVLAVMATDVSFWVMPLLFFHYIWDTAYTFIQRWRRGDAVTQAHRSHLYQLMNGLGLSHAQVTSIYAVLGILQGLGAWSLVRLDATLQLWVFVPFIALQLILTRVVNVRARAKGLLD